ncbi:MAG: argininosuccinate synthase [Abditibacteriota bacterium]|nr:argininosuccinate synthase [Abditibacteriota bacterium]
MSRKVIIVYSGGLDTSVCIPMMREDYGFDEIVTVTVNVGLPAEEIKQAEDKAIAMGCKHYTKDCVDEFAKDYIFKAIKANGDYQGYPLSTSIARPLVSQKAAEVAEIEGGEAFCHGCTGKGNDQFRIEFGLRALQPDMKIIAPMREHTWTRSAEIEYARERNIPITVSAEKIWSIDENLWGRSIEGGKLEDPYYAPPEEIFKWTKSIADAKSDPTEVVVTFEKGEPVAIDGVKLDPVSLVKKAHQIAGDNGVGRIDMMEDRILGLKVRENYECPAAKLLIPAHKALEELVLTKEEREFKNVVDMKWSRLTYDGLWWDPFKEDLESFIDKTQQRVTGDVRVRLFKGSLQVIGRRSPFALYNEDLASFDSKTWDQNEATGIVKNHGMQSIMYRKVMQGK